MKKTGSNGNNEIKRNNLFTSGNKKIDDFIQRENDRRKFKFEWISYNQFIVIEETYIQGFVTAIWEDDLSGYEVKSYLTTEDELITNSLYYDDALDEFLDKIKSKDIVGTILDGFLDKIKLKETPSYGMSQNPDTNVNYILISHKKYFEKYCENCDEKYTDKIYKWCKPCQINYLKSNFTNWTSGEKKIDEFIQKKQLQIDNLQDLMFEWIPYNQFSGIRERENGFSAAIWKDGPLKFDKCSKKYPYKK
ncbi:unnamed protein product [Rhizophagus irregularis]|nr:unnamed protein product [Rhizophagus irregularis]